MFTLVVRARYFIIVTVESSQNSGQVHLVDFQRKLNGLGIIGGSYTGTEYMRTVGFHQLRDLHGLPDDRGVLLEVAALLHDIGEVVNVRGHHKHSEYMIRWARLPGLDDTSREIIALLARTHRKDGARAKQIISESALPKELRGQVRKLSALLRVADGLRD